MIGWISKLIYWSQLSVDCYWIDGLVTIKYMMLYALKKRVIFHSIFHHGVKLALQNCSVPCSVSISKFINFGWQWSFCQWWVNIVFYTSDRLTAVCAFIVDYPTWPEMGVTKAPFVNFSISKLFDPVKVDLHHIYIWQVSPQLSCGNTCQIWTWYTIASM